MLALCKCTKGPKCFLVWLTSKDSIETKKWHLQTLGAMKWLLSIVSNHSYRRNHQDNVPYKFVEIDLHQSKGENEPPMMWNESFISSFVDERKRPI